VSTPPRLLLTLSAYACEGGFDGRHQPATCYCPTIALGWHPGPGDADRLWDEYERVIDVAADAGVTGISLEASWARLEPRRGRRDDVARVRYAEVITHARRRGLFVNVAAIDAAWPAWLGLDAWLMPWVLPVAAQYVTWLASAFEADSLSVFADREQLTRGYLDDRAGPPWRRDAADAADARRNLDTLDAMVRASGVTVVTSAFVELDELPTDAGDVDQVHVRSLVRGTGPLAHTRGLLARRAGQWVVADERAARRLRGED